MQETFFSFFPSYARINPFRWNHRLTTFSYDATRLIRDTVVSSMVVAAEAMAKAVDDDEDDLLC